MTANRFTRFIAALVVLMAAGKVSAMTVDVIDASNTPGPDETFFIPAPGMEFATPYFRYLNQDWDWKHNAIAGSIGFAELSITAWDADNPSNINGVADELDLIQAFNSNSGIWETLGKLEGTTNSFSTTTFSLGSSWFDEIQNGLMVKILIDQNFVNFWGVSLKNSVLTTRPGVIPLPAAAWLFGSALLGLAGFVRRRRSI